jgi:hypothetical protein
MDTQDLPGVEDDPHAHWAVPALERLRSLPLLSSGMMGDEHYHDPPPLQIPERQMPPPPKDMEDQAAVRKWLDHCWALRTIIGSGN